MGTCPLAMADSRTMWHDAEDRLSKAVERFEEGALEAARIMLRNLDRRGVIRINLSGRAARNGEGRLARPFSIHASLDNLWQIPVSRAFAP